MNTNAPKMGSKFALNQTEATIAMLIAKPSDTALEKETTFAKRISTCIDNFNDEN